MKDYKELLVFLEEVANEKDDEDREDKLVTIMKIVHSTDKSISEDVLQKLHYMVEGLFTEVTSIYLQIEGDSYVFTVYDNIKRNVLGIFTFDLNSGHFSLKDFKIV